MSEGVTFRYESLVRLGSSRGGDVTEALGGSVYVTCKETS